MQHSWGLSRLSISRRSQDPCWHRAPAPRVAAGRVSLCCNAVQSGAGGTAAAAAQTAGPLPTADRDKVAAAEAALVEALLAIQGRGRGTSAKQQQVSEWMRARAACALQVAATRQCRRHWLACRRVNHELVCLWCAGGWGCRDGVGGSERCAKRGTLVCPVDRGVPGSSVCRPVFL